MFVRPIQHVCVAVVLIAASGNLAWPQAALFGVVKNETTDLPIRGALIIAEGVDASGRATASRAQSSAQGEFVVPRPTGARYLRVEASGFVASTIRLEEAIPGAALQVRLTQADRLEGRVVDDGTGLPLEAYVLVGFRTNQRAHEFATTTSGVDGVFSQEVRAGHIRVLIKKEGYSPAQAFVEVPISAPFVIRLKPEASIEGMVVGAAGRPLSGVRVRLSPRGEGSPFGMEALSSADGSFRLPHVGVDTTYDVLVVVPECGEFAASPVRLRSGERLTNYRVIVPGC